MKDNDARERIKSLETKLGLTYLRDTNMHIGDGNEFRILMALADYLDVKIKFQPGGYVVKKNALRKA